MIFIDKIQDPWYFYDNGTEVPDNPTDIEITEDANNYYWENKHKFNIDLDKIPGDVITLEGIKQYAIDGKSEKLYELGEIDKKLLEIRNNEYLESLLIEGEITPATFSINVEQIELIARKKELLREIEGI